MPQRKMASNSLKNLVQFNRENNSLTREALETALIYLLQTKQLASITISELVKTAGVSRNAFYRNYKSKEEILTRKYGQISQQLLETWSSLQHKLSIAEIQSSFGEFLKAYRLRLKENNMMTQAGQWIKSKTTARVTSFSNSSENRKTD